MNPPNGNSPGHKPLVNVWRPEERMVWLAAKGCPPFYRLVTVAEMSILQASFTRGQILEDHFKRTAETLDKWGYWQDFPDILHAANAAAFDARRYYRSQERAEHAIAIALQVYELLAAGHPDFAGRSDALQVRDELASALAFIRLQRADPVPPPVEQQKPDQKPTPPAQQ